MSAKGDLNSKRRIISKLRDKEVAKKLYEEVGPEYKDRKGGYTRILKTGFRYGDCAPTAIIELVKN